MPASQSTTSRTRAGIPRVATLTLDQDRLAAMWRMSPDERCAAARRGALSLGEMLQWASRRPEEVPIVDGEFFFIAAQSFETPFDPSQDS